MTEEVVEEAEEEVEEVVDLEIVLGLDPDLNLRKREILGLVIHQIMQEGEDGDQAIIMLVEIIIMEDGVQLIQPQLKVVVVVGDPVMLNLRLNNKKVLEVGVIIIKQKILNQLNKVEGIIFFIF